MRVVKALLAVRKTAKKDDDDDNDRDGAGSQPGMLRRRSTGVLRRSKSSQKFNMQTLVKDAGGEALRQKIKAKIKPMCEKRGLPWIAVEGVVDEIDTQEELEIALEDLDGFLEDVAMRFGRDVVLAKAAEKLKPTLERRGIPWEVTCRKAANTRLAQGPPSGTLSYAPTRGTASWVRCALCRRSRRCFLK